MVCGETPGTQLVQGAVEDLCRRRILDELHQRFDGIGILDTLRHRHGEFLLDYGTSRLVPDDRRVRCGKCQRPTMIA